MLIRIFFLLVILSNLCFSTTSLGQPNPENSVQNKFTGKWDVNVSTNSIILTLVQNGEEVIGTYHVGLGSTTLSSFKGEVIDGQLEFNTVHVTCGSGGEHCQYYYGGGIIRLSEDGKTFSGHEKYSIESSQEPNMWMGKRMDWDD